MAIVLADWSVDNATGDIRYIGGGHGASPTYATVIELHRFLQDLADDASFVGNDELDITVVTPSDRSTDNIITLINSYNIDATAAEHLYDGSIIQTGGATIYDGFVVIGSSTAIQIIQDGAVLADDWWNSNSGLNPDSANGISHRFMLLVRDAGADIDGRRIVSTTRNFGFTFGEFKINGTARGNNVIALTQASDLNNQTASGTVATWTSIVNDLEGYSGIDADGNAANEFYYSNWELGTQSKNDFYERLKYLSRDGTAETLYGLSGELFRGITHQIAIDAPTGTFVQPEEVSWSGGTGQLLAIDSVTAGTTMWIQILTGVAPTDNQLITGVSTATALVNVTVTDRLISTPFVGASTGSAIIGSYGFGIGADDLGTNDRVVALDNVTRQPPNNVTFSVGGLVIGEDRVLVGPESAGNLNKTQMTIATTALSAANITSVEVNAIPGGTPSAGTIRVVDNAGNDRRLVYTSFTGVTFTIDPTASEAAVANVADFDTTGAAISNGVYVSYIDKLATATTESFTSVYPGSDVALFIRVRDGAGTPIKTFETTGTLGSGGGTTTAIRTSDA
jgi:hypothetical protein